MVTSLIESYLVRDDNSEDTLSAFYILLRGNKSFEEHQFVAIRLRMEQFEFNYFLNLIKYDATSDSLKVLYFTYIRGEFENLILKGRLSLCVRHF